MDNYSILIRKQIKLKFKTIENFSKYMKIPRTTINFILKKGVNASSYGTITRVFDALDITPVRNNPVVINDQSLELLKKYSRLDEVGKHTVCAVAEAEYRRLNPISPEDAVIAAYGSLSEDKPVSDNEKAILELAQKIKESSADNE